MQNTDHHNDHYDTVIVGAGFAGLTAARELADAGQRVLVIEGRDRTGGRTWTDDRLGLDLEMGGTWVHWTQPYVWRELAHYGIGTVKSPDIDRAVWFDESGRRESGIGELFAELDPACSAFGADARTYFPHGFDPFTNPAAGSLDHLTVDDRIAQLDLTPTQQELLRSFWALNFNGRTDQAAYTQALRWLASTNGDWQVMLEACTTYKVKGGMKALTDAIHNDAMSRGAEFRFGERVLGIDSADNGATVVTDSGQHDTDRVVVTVPLHVLGNIRFTGDLGTLGGTVDRAVQRGQVGRGTKVWVTITSETEPFLALGRPDWPITMMQGEYPVDGGVVAVCFGSDATTFNISDRDAVTEAVRRIIPDAKIGEFAAHDWVTDEFAGETWPMHAPGYFNESLPVLVQGTDRIRFAGSDYATGWGGFVDGAVESAIQQSRRIIDEVAESAADTPAADRIPVAGGQS
ncbi:flavin monoamine oxidase family protein [Corynebacterium variabile]|uniref:flavin monoamine oxidase family protein n=1 Tax=Corynebacterium variabile TaxID=1727 RepID=UPI0028A2496A|nr:NAD(P)/FAD-dependent oxidoreductase [Corynebacterium variabile]